MKPFRILTASKKGIRALVEETLANMPYDERFRVADGEVNNVADHKPYKEFLENLPVKIQILEKQAETYIIDKNGDRQGLHILGPHDHIPHCVVAGSGDELKEIKKIAKTRAKETGGQLIPLVYAQTQLLLLNDLIMHNKCILDLYSHRTKMRLYSTAYFGPRTLYIRRADVDALRDSAIKVAVDHVVREIKSNAHGQNTKIVVGSDETILETVLTQIEVNKND